MKKFENLGESLSKAKQKNIIGGFGEGGGGCPSGEFKYNCCLDWLEGPPTNEDQCADTLQHARVRIHEKHPNLLTDVTCSLPS
jgi:hypothetical protein